MTIECSLLTQGSERVRERETIVMRTINSYVRGQANTTIESQSPSKREMPLAYKFEQILWPPRESHVVVACVLLLILYKSLSVK